MQSSIRHAALLALAAFSAPALAAGPDVIVGDLPAAALQNMPAGSGGGQPSGSTLAFSIATTSCNIGNARLSWNQNPSNQHPVIAQNLYRYKVVGGVGRFEQIGMSFVKHGFFALSESLCSPCNDSTNGTQLGVGCSDPYSTGNNSSQGSLGPRTQINPSNGVYPTSWSTILTGAYTLPTSGNEPSRTLWRRGNVLKADLDTTLNSGAQYFAEGQYITPDDSASGNGLNNNSYRRIVPTGSGTGGGYTLAMSSSTQRQKYAIQAWKEVSDPNVTIVNADIPGDGRVVLGYRVTDLGGGSWAYEYAIQNITSDRAVGSFSVPMGPCAVESGVGFHDMPYHSGEPIDGADWPAVKSSTDLSWSTVPFATNANANAIRWGTLYNFRFVANAAPIAGSVTLGLFKPGTGTSIAVSALVPTPCEDPCVIELDGVPGVDINDLLVFLDAFEAGTLIADIDEDGALPATADGVTDLNDLLLFLYLFETGC